MKRLGFVLAFVVFLATLSVSVVPVRADGQGYALIVREYYLDEVNMSQQTFVYSPGSDVYKLYLPSGGNLNVELVPGDHYIDYKLITASEDDLKALFAINARYSGKMQYKVVFDDIKTQLNITYTPTGEMELYLQGVPGVTKVYVFYVYGHTHQAYGTTDVFQGSVQFNETKTGLFVGSVWRNCWNNDFARAYAIPSWDVYNQSDPSTYVLLAEQVQNGNNQPWGHTERTVIHPGVRIAVNWDEKVDGGPSYGASSLILFEGGEITYITDGDVQVQVVDVIPYTLNVRFNIKDALTGQALSGVTVKENGNVIATIDDSGTLELTKGQHTLTFEKQGYWSVTKTIDVQGDMSVSVEMYPSSAAFKFVNFPSDISIPENTIYELTFTLSPIDTSATYNTYLSLSGLSNVLEVKKDGSAISPESGKYYLGDISSPVQVSIKFKAGAVGQHGFTITLTSNDAIMSKTYTTTKQVTYQVEPLPFSVQMPSEWQVGENQLRISESSGQSYLITAVLKDSQGNEVWSDSYAFSPYEAHTFSINVPSEGSYTLELQFNGQTAVYDVQVNPAITLVTKTLTVSEGAEGVITLHFKNPSSSVQYYTIKVSGGFLPAEINQSISVAPLSEKDVSITFAVPEDLTYDAYELNVQVLQGDAVVFSDNVAVTIDSGGFTLFGGGSNTPTWAYALVGLLVLGGLVFVLRRR